MIRRALASLVAVSLLLVPTGCGGSGQSAADQVPALSARLDGVDAAVAAQRYRLARDRIGDLVDATVTARDAGELDRTAAERILAAAAQLLTSLPVVTATPTPTPTPTSVEPKKPEPKKPAKHPGKGKGPGKHDRDDEDDDD